QLKELCMVALSANIRSKPDWWNKFKDPVIRARWKAEALSSTMLKLTLSEAQVEYVLEELEGYRRLLDEVSGIQVSCFDGVWQSDSLISQNVRDALVEAVYPLENVPEEMKDWHPHSNNLVLDIVHPSLYCVVYGRTLAHLSPHTEQASGVLQTVTAPAKLNARLLISNRFQWLPTDFVVSETGEVTALGYINNIHPTHKSLYKSVENILSCFIPMFERVLTDLRYDDNPLPHRISGDYFSINHDLDKRYPKEEYADTETFWEAWENEKTVFLPDIPKEGYTGGLESRKCVVKLRGRNIQVIVKLANIHLTPQKPQYGGGTWHVEGMANEAIVASGICYYDNENVSDSELAFRVAVEEPLPSTQIQAEPYDYYAHKVQWGMRDTTSELNQCAGAVSTTSGRCIAFPNTYQHRVSSFELMDPTKPGHRKILAFFLVDPDQPPIPSTSIVPPQQVAWARDALLECAADPKSRMHLLPPEIVTLITDTSDMMDDEEAKDIRLKLMDERSSKLGDEDKDVFARRFNLCEH
ncbi:hypothetical protein BD410DRAFT_727256, partial [Rickenella mellea]